MNIENMFDFMDALRKQDSAEDFIDSDGIGTALEEIAEYDLGKPSHGSRSFGWGHGYKLELNYVTVYFEVGCSCCRESDSHLVSYQNLWDHLVKKGIVAEIEE